MTAQLRTAAKSAFGIKAQCRYLAIRCSLLGSRSWRARTGQGGRSAADNVVLGRNRFGYPTAFASA